jgi:large subunit ribosomal protein L35
MPWRFLLLFGLWSARSEKSAIQRSRKESKMPKMKTKSAAKKRFKITATGKVLSAAAGKRHGMIKRSNEQIRELRGTSTMSASETQRVRRWMPYSA